MILTDDERKIVLQAMSLLHLTTDQEKDLFNRLRTSRDYDARKQYHLERERKFKSHLATLYGSNSHLHVDEYYQYCRDNPHIGF